MSADRSSTNPFGSMLVRWVTIAVAAVALLGIATFDSSGPETTTERVQRLHESFACPQCDGQSVAESNAAVAAEIRNFISDEVRAGSTDTEIRDQLIGGYGGDVLLNPPAEGFSALIWILPVVVVVLGAAGWVAVIRRDGDGSRSASVADEALVTAARRESASLRTGSREESGPEEPGPGDTDADTELIETESIDTDADPESS